MYKIVLIGILIWNIVVFLLFGLDKFKAKYGFFRLSEKSLILISFLGGGIGSFLGMKIFHHKTKHIKFKILVPLNLIIQTILCLVFILYKCGYIK